MEWVNYLWGVCVILLPTNRSEAVPQLVQVFQCLVTIVNYSAQVLPDSPLAQDLEEG